MKETYYVKLPKHIVFGDPWYFEEYSGEKLDSLVVDMNPPSHFQARVVLEAVQDEKYPDAMLHTLCLYMAPEQTIQTYMQDMFYESASILLNITSAWTIVTIPSIQAATVTGVPTMK